MRGPLVRARSLRSRLVGYGFRARRGVMLLATMVVVTLAALIGSSILFGAITGRGAGQVSARQTQSRALAWSGVQGVMAELAAQRTELLQGNAPVLTREWTLFGGSEGSGKDGGARGIARLVAIHAESDEVAESEAAKLDVNSATAEMLAKLPGVTEEIAAAIVAARQKKPFTCAEELAGVAGITAKMLLGDPETEPGVSSRSLEEPLLSLVTVFSFDPAIQAGSGDGGSEFRGQPRISLDGAWDEKMRGEIAKRFGDQVAKEAEKLFKGKTGFHTDAELVAFMLTMGKPDATWMGTLDACSTGDDDFRPGRVDLRRASEAVLACVPGISKEAAAKIVGMRDALGEDERSSVAWPVLKDVLKPEEFQQAVDYLSIRTMQWRVRIEAGTATGGEERLSGRVLVEAAPLRDRVMLEAVVDVSGKRPRLAYLRDVTYLDLSRRSMGEAPAEGSEEEESERVADGGGVRSQAESESDSPSSLVDDGLGTGAVIPRAKVDLPVDLGLKKPPVPSEGVGGGVDSGEKSDSEKTAPAARPRQDRRIGRWTSGGKRGG